MARDKLSEYSATASENTVCGDVNIAENSALPSDMNNFAREVMSHLKNFSDGTDAITGLTVDGNIKLDGNYPTGSQNVAMGDTALDDGSLSGNGNTAIGHAAMTANTSGSNNVGVGKNALLANTTGADNVAVGKNNMDANSTGSNNTALGSGALTSNTTANNNTALGYQALAANTTGYSNTAVGAVALNATTTGRDNTAIGHGALDANTTANNNVAIGKNALGVNTTGAGNVAVGAASLDANTTGAGNVAVGLAALGANTTASNNTAIGENAGLTTAAGDSNVFVGEEAGKNSNSNRNTFVGRHAGRVMTATGTAENTFIGCFSGRYVTTGKQNTIVGCFDGNSHGLDIRTSSNNIIISDGAGQPRLRIGSGGDARFEGDVLPVIDAGYTGHSDLGDPNARFEDAYVRDGVTTGSDQQDKTNIADSDLGLTFINSLRPVSYRWSDGSRTHYGIVAQELETAISDAGKTNADFAGIIKNDSPIDGRDYVYGVRYQELIAPLIKAIQEQQATITSLEARITALEA